MNEFTLDLSKAIRLTIVVAVIVVVASVVGMRWRCWVAIRRHKRIVSVHVDREGKRGPTATRLHRQLIAHECFHFPRVRASVIDLMQLKCT